MEVMSISLDKFYKLIYAYLGLRSPEDIIGKIACAVRPEMSLCMYGVATAMQYAEQVTLQILESCESGDLLNVATVGFRHFLL